MAAPRGCGGFRCLGSVPRDIDGLGELTGGSADRGVVVGGKFFCLSPLALSLSAIALRPLLFG